MPELVEIYDSEASYAYTQRAADMTSRAMAPDAAVEPRWGVHLWDSRRGRRMAIIPHARLESTVVAHGYDPDDLLGIMNAVLHLPFMPAPGDPLAWEDPVAAAVLTAAAEIPDPLTPGMPDQEKHAATEARIAVVREHRATIDPATREDRQGALDWRRAVILARGDVPEEYQQGFDDQAPEHALNAILNGARLDPARIAARRAQARWIQERREHAASRRAALMGPDMFGFARAMPGP
ncbi:hypothetical protein [Sphaerisporangium aureirubrum]|uniref:PE-PGRS family protein n=1 Tax=Sphaerisporangium aureirubrum TaxID=1544736 RepID=A0ABW1ND64_9ACTN